MSLKLYKKLFSKDTTNIEYNYRLGISFLKCNNNPSEALQYLLKAKDIKQQEPQFLFDLGQAYLYNYKLSDAKTNFQQCAAKSAKNEELRLKANLWYNMAENAEKMKKSPLDVSFINMGKYINSVLDEENPFVTADNEILLYTTNRKFDRDLNIHTYDVVFSNKTVGIFKKGKLLSAVNTVDDEFMAGVSLSNNRIYVQLQGYDGFQDIISAERKGKGYKEKTFLNKNVNSKYAEFAACETVNNDTLFFSSARDGGYGGMDLYYSRKLPTGEWSIPTNLGDKINTAYDEDFPVVSSGGNKLYFTSNNTQSMGGYDIFESRISKNREFGQPKNIGYPLNDVFDNKTIAFSDNERYAYVSAIRPEGFGYTDLYRVVFNQKDPAVKIYILKFKIGSDENKTAFANSDTTLNISAHQKGKVLFGKYAYDSKSSSATIALPPGNYTIEILGTKTELYSYKINVPDTPSGNKIEKKNIILKLKK